MEKDFYTDEFEQLIKEKADQFSMYPSRRVWHSIYNNLHPSRRWPSLVMSLFLLSSLVFIGYLNTGDNSLGQRINNYTANNTLNEKEIIQNNTTPQQTSTYTKTQHQPAAPYTQAFDDVITNETDFQTYTIVRSNRPERLSKTLAYTDNKPVTDNNNQPENARELIQTMDTYIKTNQIFTDIAAVTNKKTKHNTANPAAKNASNDDVETDAPNNVNRALPQNQTARSLPATVEAGDKKAVVLTDVPADKDATAAAEKAWIENYAFNNKAASPKWKGRLGYQVYATPAVNYRKLTTNSKGSATAFANGDINNSISQKPGFGFEAGAGLTYSVAKKVQLKAGLQFNYTNYNIDADQTNHPIITTILMNDPNTGYSYSAARTSTTANAYDGSALQPVTLHNRTYQISLPVGMVYKLSSKNNVDWFAGASVQPTYVFGGNAHLISSDLKSYVSDPSSIRTWNLNLGFETYMNFKLGGYNLQVGPQVRYQVYSTYSKNVALIEKPYAVGLKLGLSKGF